MMIVSAWMVTMALLFIGWALHRIADALERSK